MANIRNQNAWVHSQEPEIATRKAKDLIRMAVAKVSSQTARKPLRIPIAPSVLIIGGGVAGMTAALNLAHQGFRIHLIEKTTQLGGNALHLFQTWNGEHVPRYLKELKEEVQDHPLIEVAYTSTVLAVSGHVGNFTTTIRIGPTRKRIIEHGAVIITTGAKRYIPEEFEYGKIPKVVASIEFDKLHMHNETRVANGKSFVFIQCVGSRNQERPYCSKSCCTHSIQSAIKLKKEAPSRQIYILYREIRTYGQRERIYNQARELGIVFINYELHGPPRVKKADNGVLVEVWDHVLHRPLEIRADVVILAAATLASPEAADLANLFKLPLNADGFFQEAHAKLRPVEFHVDGVFVAGLGPLSQAAGGIDLPGPGRRRQGRSSPGPQGDCPGAQHRPGGSGPLRRLRSLYRCLPLPGDHLGGIPGWGGARRSKPCTSTRCSARAAASARAPARNGALMLPVSPMRRSRPRSTRPLMKLHRWRRAYES